MDATGSWPESIRSRPRCPEPGDRPTISHGGTQEPQAGQAVPVHHAPGDQRDATVDLTAGQGAARTHDPWRNRTTHVEWDAVDFSATPAAPVRPPRVHLTRFHGVCAPNANLRAPLIPSGRGKRAATDAARVAIGTNDESRGPGEQCRAMTWAQRIEWVFSIDASPASKGREAGDVQRSWLPRVPCSSGNVEYRGRCT